MRPRFGVAPDAYSAYQPTSYEDALFPANRKYFFYTPTQERKGLPCPIIGGFQAKPIPAIHLAMKRRDTAAPQQQPQVTSMKQWVTMTNDTDALLASSSASDKAALGQMMASHRAAAQQASSSIHGSGAAGAQAAADTREVLALISGSTQQSHATDFVKTCIFGPGGSQCSSTSSELFPDTYIFLARRGYCAPVAIGAGDVTSSGGAACADEGASGGTVRATHAAMLNPLLDPTMTCTALNNMLPAELRIYRGPEEEGGSSTRATSTYDEGNTSDNDVGGNNADVVGHGTHKASSSSSFMFSKNPKVFRIKPIRPLRIEKPVRRGAMVTVGGLLVPSLGGRGTASSSAGASGKTSKPRGKKSGGAADDEDVSLAEKFGGMAGLGMGADDDDFAITNPTIGSKRGREGGVDALDEAGNARVDDGGDGVESNGDADTNSLSSFSGDDDDNEDMSDGGSEGELYL